MTVLELMERTGMREETLAIAYIKDAIHLIQSNTKEKLDVNKQDIELLDYVKYLIRIRKHLTGILNPVYLAGSKNNENIPKYHWHGPNLDSPDWSSWSHTIAFSINKGKTNPLIWVGLNAYSKSIDFCVPKSKGNWLKIIDTSMSKLIKASTFNDKKINIKSQSSVLIISEEVFGTKNNIL